MVAGITRALLSSVIRRGKFIRKKASKLPYSEDYIRRAKRFPNRKIAQGQRKSPGHYSSAVGKDYYDDFIKDFSKLYKSSGKEGIATLRAGIGKTFWETSRESAKSRKLITPKDTYKVHQQQHMLKGESQPWLEKYYQPRRDLRQKKREALQSVWNGIVKSAAKDKDGLPILYGPSEFHPINTIPKLKEKFPKLFSNIENDKLGRKRLHKLIRPTKVDKQMQYPKFRKESVNIDEESMFRQVPNYTGEETLGKEARQYLVDIFRSRPSEFRTGDYKKDSTKFLTFLRRQDFFDPKSDYYYKNTREFRDYYLTRRQPPGEVQDFRRGLDLSHDQPTLVPGGEAKKFPTQEYLPWTGGEIGRTHYLPRDVNRNIQTGLEMKAIDAVKKKDWKKLIQLDKQMIRNNIRTTVSDPITGEEFPMGGWKEFGFNKGGAVDRFQAGGLASLLGKKLLKKLATKLSEKELKMLMGSLWKGVDPRRSPRYKVWDKKRWGPGYKWPWQKSKIKGPEIKESHFASLTPGERVEIQSKNADELWEYQMKKKLNRPMGEALEYPFLNPDKNSFIVTGPRTGLGRYQLQHYVDPENVGPIDKYKVYDWWDDILNKMHKKPKFKYVKDAKGNVIMRKVK